MKLVIDLPDNMVKMCGWHKEGICELTDIEVNMLAEAIDKGKPLPSGCGKLIDADSLIKAIEEKTQRLKNLDTINGLCGAVALIYDAEAIIESDKTESEEEDGRES